MQDIETIKQKMFNVVGALLEVHRTLGAGLNEYVYQAALRAELELRNVPYEKEVTIHPTYKGKVLDAVYRMDFVVDGIIVEMKAVEAFTNEHRAQLFNYIRLFKSQGGILVNMYPRYCAIERYLYDCDKNEVLTMTGNVIRTR